MRSLLLSSLLIVAPAFAQQATTRLVPVGTPVGVPMGPMPTPGAPINMQAQPVRTFGMPPVNVAGARNTSFAFAPSPVIDNGPSDLTPTDLFMCRTISVDFEGKYSQEASVNLPIYYHSGYLNLNQEDQQRFKELDVEFRSLLTEYESLVNRFTRFMAKYNDLNERGRPRGVIDPAQFLVPYAGNGTSVQDPVDPLKIIRTNSGAAGPNVQTSPQRIINVAPQSERPTQGK